MPAFGYIQAKAYTSRAQLPVEDAAISDESLTDDDVDLEELGYFIGQFTNLKALDVLPYHTMGEVKYKKLGMEYKLKGVPAMDKNVAIEKKKVVLKGIKKRRTEMGLMKA